ncbi:unnamed protein product [Strongylus vulgaris]|uniref:Secreted protein n=1 Tax=Strongylus vulgaris TaxID=40348 RepID=A0A3P7KYE1_STRVU|nr:unnamed protein product [Strongylus vulgaris]
MTQVVALAVISRLHEWCIQLFWITIFCVMGCCGDEKSQKSIRQLHERQQHQQQTSRKRASIAEIEQKVCVTSIAIDFRLTWLFALRLTIVGLGTG